MRYVIHGDDQVSSRNYLNSLKSRYDRTNYLDGQKISLSDFEEIAINQPILPEEIITIVENYKGSDKIYEIKFLSDVVFWWPKTLSKVPEADRVLFFKNPSVYGVFKYADSVGQKKTKLALNLLVKLQEERTPPEKIIAILARQLKNIGQALDGDVDKTSSSDFVRKKLLNQSKLWSIKKIQAALTILFQTEVKIKSGEVRPEPALTFLTYKMSK